MSGTCNRVGKAEEGGLGGGARWIGWWGKAGSQKSVTPSVKIV